MARRTATAAARSASGRSAPSAPVRRRPARRPPPRRRSGPAYGRAAALPLPARVLRAPFARAARARASGVLDALLQGRAWIALVAVLLVGIVFFNVDLLELNRGIARTADRAAALKRENAELLLQEARLASSERIQRVAARRGLELPAPGDVRYLRLHPGADALTAAARITAPGSAGATPVASGVVAPAPTPVTSSPTPTPTTPTTPSSPAPTSGAQGAPTTTSPGTQTSPTPAAPPATAPAGSPAGGTAPAPASPGG